MKTFAEPKIVTKKGKPVSVILPIKDYREMMELLEDATDIVVMFTRCDAVTSISFIGWY